VGHSVPREVKQEPKRKRPAPRSDERAACRARGDMERDDQWS
jgi:hypothetical protein